MRSILWLVTLGFIALTAPARAETITLVADSWCPYNCAPEDEHPGFIIEIAKQAFAKHGIEVQYSVLPWTRAIEETRLGKYTAIVAASRDDAPDFVYPKVPQGWMRNMFYVKKGSTWRYSGIKSLNGISLGTIADYSYNPEIDGYIAKHRGDMKYIQVISGDNALETNVKKLLAGRIGALIEGQYVMDYYLSQHPNAGQMEVAGSLPATDTDNLFVAFSPKGPKAKQYAKILSDEMQAMRKSGELAKILASYNLKDWQP